MNIQGPLSNQRKCASILTLFFCSPSGKADQKISATDMLNLKYIICKPRQKVKKYSVAMFNNPASCGMFLKTMQ